MYNEPSEPLDLPGLLPNIPLELLNRFRQAHTVIFVPFGDGDDILLELGVLLSLHAERFSEFVGRRFGHDTGASVAILRRRLGR